MFARSRESAVAVNVHELRREAADLRVARGRYSLGAPVALVVLGVITTGVGGFFLGGFALSAWFDWGADALERGLVISGAVTLAGLGLEALGVVMIISRIAARRPLERRLDEVRRELADYGLRASLGVRPVREGVVLTGTLSF